MCQTFFIFTFTANNNFSKKIRSSPSAVSRYLTMIISYLLLVLLLTWNLHDTILVALNSGKQIFLFTFYEVVNFLAWFSHIFSSDAFFV